ncbi:AmmeMemoRadiSam system protein A [Vallitalea okinawensis]|uniref:AmmeMemoRadiSam system protein A n=1 Tax=Vallitalea okinawensis TaxID=2078660 RepID=UPI000CFDA469|nr:AmmeMemoRadiSam system protein A [Vallitalea okinawensis]
MSIKGLMVCPHPPVILPEVGEGRERGASSTIEGMKKIAKQVNDIKPDTIVCITPHGNVFRDGISIIGHEKIKGDLSSFGKPQVKMEKATHLELYHKLVEELDDKELPYINLSNDVEEAFDIKGELDHGCIVPLYYIDQEYKDYEILHMTYGLMDYITLYEVGMALQKAAESIEKKVLVLASGDLSHCLMDKGPYEYHPSGQLFDELLLKSVKECHFKDLFKMDEKFIGEAKECGLRSFIMGLGSLDHYELSSKVYSYEGPFGVGYMTAFIRPESTDEYSLYEGLVKQQYMIREKNRFKEDDFIKLARRAICEWVKNSKKVTLTEEEINLLGNKRAGTFVSLHKDGELRGCIGTVQASESNVGKEIINNAIQAATSDPRFMPVSDKELEDLDIKVDVLHELELIKDIDELDVDKYGVVVQSGLRRGLLLPRLEGVDTVEKQVSIALQKAGIEPDEFYKMYRFEVERHEV